MNNPNLPMYIRYTLQHLVEGAKLFTLIGLIALMYFAMLYCAKHGIITPLR